MGRKSALTPEQWVEVERRHLVDGQSVNSLAKEFGVNEGTIRKRLNPNKSELQNVAKPLQVLASEKVEAEKKLREISEKVAEFPIARQNTFNSLVTKLANISTHMASGAEYSAATFHRLSALAHQESAKVDDVNPLGDPETLRGIAALQSLANEAAKTPINLLAANKEEVARVNRGDADKKPLTLSDLYDD